MRYHKHSRRRHGRFQRREDLASRRVERAIETPAREISRPNGLHPWIALAVGVVGSIIMVAVGIGGAK